MEESATERIMRALTISPGGYDRYKREQQAGNPWDLKGAGQDVLAILPWALGGPRMAPIPRALPPVNPVVNALGSPTGSGIRAYHGSPYDFDKFDLGKIGSGEGAQAYGHGLYFSENPAVAKEYRDVLTGILNNPPPQYVDATPQFLRKVFPNMPPIYKEQAAAQVAGPGRMYEVNINAKPEHFLDWDRPISQQPYVGQQLAGAKNKPFGDIRVSGEYPGRTVYRPAWGGKPEDISNALKDAGIPGIKYLDQGSRSAGQGTSNYVVFDPSLIEILKKYGLAGSMLGGAAYQNKERVD